MTQYEIDIEVPLPGMFNDFEWKMPITLQSGVTSASQPQAPQFRVPQIGLPQWVFLRADLRLVLMPELSRDYYSGEYHSWDE